MLACKPELRQHMVQLQRVIGMKGGPDIRLERARQQAFEHG
jgi:hypothetical protein